MPPKKKRRGVKTKFVPGQSSSILPARAPGEPLILRVSTSVKREDEEEETSQESVVDLGNTEEVFLDSSGTTLQLADNTIVLQFITNVNATLASGGEDLQTVPSGEISLKRKSGSEEMPNDLQKKLKMDSEDEEQKSKKLGKSASDPAEAEPNDGYANSQDHQNAEDDIVVVAVPKVETDIPVITVSDEEEDNQVQSGDVTNASHQKPSSPPPQPPSASTTQSHEEKPFSTHILKYFSCVSELDRYECQAVLCHLTDDILRKKPKHTYQKFFPTVKRERNSSIHKIQKGDILFKKAATDSDAESAPTSPNSDSRAPEKSFLNAAESVDIPSTSQAAVCSSTLPTTPASSSFEVNSSLNSRIPVSLAPSSYIRQDFPHMFVNQPQVHSNLHTNHNFMPPNMNDSMSSSNPYLTGSAIQVSYPVPFPPTPFQATAPLFNNAFQWPSYLTAAPYLGPASSNYDPRSQVSFSPVAPLPGCDFQRFAVPNNFPGFLYTPTVSSSPVNMDPRLSANKTQTVSSSPVNLDPRLANKTKSHTSSENRNKVANTTVRHCAVPFTPVNDEIPRSVASTPTSCQAKVPSEISSVKGHSRLAAANKVTFLPRKGTKELHLYCSIGKSDITDHFDRLILQWNPSWLQVQKETGVWPPICDSYQSVRYFYSDEFTYYNTYVALQMLNLWQAVVEWYERDKRYIHCKYQSVAKYSRCFRISCATKLEVADRRPKRDDIVCVKHNGKQAFALVIHVEERSTDSDRVKKLKIRLESVHDFKFKDNDKFSFAVVFNIRVERMKIEAIQSLDETVKALVLNPKDYAKNIEVINLSPNKVIKEQKDDIMKRVDSKHATAIVVETYDNCKRDLLITHVIHRIVFGDSATKHPAKVLIFTKTETSFNDLVNRLSVYSPVLAVRAKQISIPTGHAKYTFANRLSKGETVSGILHKNDIFLTTFSAFDSAYKEYLCKHNKWTCIVDEASICTEAETALPLSLKLKNLLLFGNKNENAALPPILHNYKYHITLFHRLTKAKQLMNFKISKKL